MAKKNNKTWALRSKHGRDKIFSNPTILLEAVGEYFAWADKNPWYKSEALKSGELAGKIIEIPAQRPYTLKALCHFLDVDFTTWQLYKERENFKAAVTLVEEYIYTQKLEGAIVGVFNSNIIARHLGLVDKTDKTTDGESINKPFYDFIKKVNTK